MNSSSLCKKPVLLCLVFVVLISFGGFCVAGCAFKPERSESLSTTKVQQQIEDAVLEEVQTAINSYPVVQIDFDDPLSYFRPRVTAEGKVISKVTSAEVEEMSIEGGTGTVRMNVESEVFFEDGSSRKMPDYPTLDIELRGENWTIVDIHVPE